MPNSNCIWNRSGGKTGGDKFWSVCARDLALVLVCWFLWWSLLPPRLSPRQEKVKAKFNEKFDLHLYCYPIYTYKHLQWFVDYSVIKNPFHLKCLRRFHFYLNPTLTCHGCTPHCCGKHWDTDAGIHWADRYSLIYAVLLQKHTNSSAGSLQSEQHESCKNTVTGQNSLTLSQTTIWTEPVCHKGDRRTRAERTKRKPGLVTAVSQHVLCEKKHGSEWWWTDKDFWVGWL